MNDFKFEISIVIPAHNSSEFLIHAINSSLGQRFPSSYEILIIGQNLFEKEINNISNLKSNKIRYIRDEGVGIVSALNLGIKESKYDWIARLDSDDVMHPNRIENQVKYLSRNPKCVAIGGQMLTIDSFGREIGSVKYPINDLVIKFALKVNSPLPHPGTLIKKEALKLVGNYNEKYELVEDFDLWRRLAAVGNLHNLRSHVTYYRKHSEQVTNTKNNQIKYSRATIIAENLINSGNTTFDMVNDIAKLEEIVLTRNFLRIFKLISSRKKNKKILLKYLFYKLIVRSIRILPI